MKPTVDRTKAGYVEGIVSIFANSTLFGLKMWAGIVTGSIALTADAWHTLSDSISSIVVILGIKLSTKKPDKEHPFGHGRWEQLSAILIGVILALIAFDFLKNSIQRFTEREGVAFGTLAIVVTIVSIVMKEALAQYAFFVGRRTGNVSVKADGWHHRTDALSSVVVLAGILLAKRFWWIDGLLGLIISLMLFYATYKIIWEAVNKLLGEVPDPEVVEKVKEIIRSAYKEETNPHHFHIHNYISHQELTFHLKLNGKMDIEKGHKIVTEIENKIREEIRIIATIHYEPFEFEHESD